VQLVLFSKMFQTLSLSEFADLVESMKLDGVDLTVRPNGYIKPEEVKEKLPKAVEIFKSRGLQVPMLTTAITSSEEPYSEEIFRIASYLGVKYIKLGYWTYMGFGYLRKQIEKVRRQLKGVEKLSKEYNITAGVHIHSGMFITAEPTVLWLILDGFDPNLVGAYIDPGHMCVEGGLAGWLMGLDILADKIRIVAIKDYGWFKVKGQWAARTVPIGQGLVQWKEVFRILKQVNFSGPLSVHSEYDAPLNKIIKLTKKDISRLRELVRK